MSKWVFQVDEVCVPDLLWYREVIVATRPPAHCSAQWIISCDTGAGSGQPARHADIAWVVHLVLVQGGRAAPVSPFSHLPGLRHGGPLRLAVYRGGLVPPAFPELHALLPEGIAHGFLASKYLPHAARVTSESPCYSCG